jgi:23S rRNA (adenine2503-C2)-methyltransferase
MISISEFITQNHLPDFRQKQFNLAYYREFISTFADLTTWPKELRSQLQESVQFTSLTAIKRIISADKSTEKVLFRRITDGKLFETVLMRHNDGRNTVCVSCMIGCPVGCTFCATGKMGFMGNLSSEEILDQILYFARILKTENNSITNIVFMGMGEPLLNLANVLAAIKVITDAAKIGFSERRVTISTSGITPQLHQLILSGYKGRLVLSLHAPNQKLRERLMPIAKKYPLHGILNELRFFAKETNKRVSYEYILIQGINDKPEHARELFELLGNNLTHINLIPYNPVPGLPFERSSQNNIDKFTKILTKCHMQFTQRITMGDDIKAACGQLAANQ